MDRNLMLCSPHVALRIPRFLLAAGSLTQGGRRGGFFPQAGDLGPDNPEPHTGGAAHNHCPEQLHLR